MRRWIGLQVAAATLFVMMPMSPRAMGQPINDDCDAAALLEIPAIVAGTTLGATPDATPFCGVTPDAPGVWYSVIGTGGTLTADLCNARTRFDTRISVYCGGCDDLVCVGGDDDACEPQSQFSWCSAPGREYLILVHGFGGAAGDFELQVHDDGEACPTPVSCGRPDNDACNDAIPLVSDQPYEGLTTGAGGHDISSCGLHDVADVWHTWEADCDGQATFTLCDSAFDTTLAVYDGCGGAELACNDDACDDRSELTRTVRIGDTLTIRVSGFAGDTGAYTIEASCVPAQNGACCLPDGVCAELSEAECDDRSGSYHPGLACEDADCPQPPPLHDACPDAHEAFEGDTPFDTIAATTDGPPHADCEINGSDQIDSDIWFVYRATARGAVTVSTCADADFDTRLAAYAGTDCPVDDARLLACNDDDPNCDGFRSRIEFFARCNETYLLRIGGYQDEQGHGLLSIDQGGICPPPVECELINRFIVKCRKGKLRISLRSSMERGTIVTVDDNGELHEIELNGRGKGSLTIRNQTGEHLVSLVECPERSKQVDCGD